MPSSKKKLKLKAKKDKKSRRLSTEEILNLIKTMRPKTQQIVKVNVGNKGEKDSSKKQAGQVQSSYNPPFVFPANGQAITTLGQPPYQPPLIAAVSRDVPAAASWSTQPIKKDEPYKPSEIIQELIDKNMSAREEFKVRAPRAPRATKTSKKAAYVPEDISSSESDVVPLRFTQPRGWTSSSLSSSSSVPSYFNLPSQNDKYQANIIHTDNSGDQIGTIANSVPSSEWTGSPEGVIAPVKAADSTAGAVASAGATDPTDIPEPDVISTKIPMTTEEFFSMDTEPEDIFIAPLKPPLKTIPPIQEEEIIIEVPKKKSSKAKAADLPPVQNPILGKKTIPDTVYEINKAIEQGYFKNTDWIPQKNTIKKGIDTGKLSSKITKDELTPIYAAFKVAMSEK
jgi:hypothetical protein